MKAIKKDFLKLVWCCLVVSLYPISFLYFNNIAEATLNDVIFPIGISVFTMFALLLFSFIFTKDLNKLGVLSSVFFLVFMNYSFLENLINKIMPNLRYWHIMPITVVILLHIAYFSIKKMPVDFWSISSRVFSVVFSVLILINLFSAVPTIINKIQVSQNTLSNNLEISILDETENSIQTYPNIYYILTDEYSNFPVLEKYYNYDNLEFKNFLLDNNFTISMDSHNESNSTVIVTTNNLNLDYVVYDYNNVDYLNYRESPYLFQLLDQYGYEIKFLSNSVPISWKDIDLKKQEATTVDGKNIGAIFCEQTIYKNFLGNRTDKNVKKFYEEFEFLNSNIKIKDCNLFVYVHLSYPHMPFIVDANGNYIGLNNQNNSGDKKYYLNQLIFTTKNIQNSIQKILEKDPDSIIILQSDHSNRWIGYGAIHGGGTIVSWEDMTNILNAVYYRGEDISEIKGLSSVNTLRAILNNVLETQLEILEVPNYGS